MCYKCEKINWKDLSQIFWFEKMKIYKWHLNKSGLRKQKNTVFPSIYVYSLNYNFFSFHPIALKSKNHFFIKKKRGWIESGIGNLVELENSKFEVFGSDRERTAE